MNKHLHLLEDILKTDFSIVYTPNNSLPNFTADTETVIDSRNSYYSLNLLTLNRSLKQFLRTLRFLRSLRGKHKKSITVYSQDKYLCALLEKLFSCVQSDINIEFKSDFTEPCRKYKTHQLVILLGGAFLSTKFLKTFTQNNIFIINKINAVSERNTSGTYKIFNNILELKKIIFLFIVVKRIISKEYA